MGKYSYLVLEKNCRYFYQWKFFSRRKLGSDSHTLFLSQQTSIILKKKTCLGLALRYGELSCHLVQVLISIPHASPTIQLPVTRESSRGCQGPCHSCGRFKALQLEPSSAMPMCGLESETADGKPPSLSPSL